MIEATTGRETRRPKDERFPGAGRPRRESLLREAAGRHPMAVDTALALFLLLVGTVPVPWFFRDDPELLWYQVALLLPLVWRRRAPYTVFGVLAAVAFVQWLFAPVLPGDVGLLVALYTVATHCSRGRTLWAAAVLELGNGLAAGRWSSTVEGAVKVFIALSGMAVAAGVIGVNLRTRRAYLAALEDRAARLERERDQRAQLAVARERSRIAREMHDIVTHSLSVMIALADGAKFAVPLAPDKAGDAMEQVSATGRQALTDMRRLLGVLRSDEPDALRHPQPGIGQLEELAGQVRAVGLPVRLTVTGEVAEVPAAAQLTVYRLVQEALTNTRRHAVPGARASVRIGCRDDRVEVEVLDDGRPAPAAGEPGHGIAGMRDRVAVYGAGIEAGPLPGGGWRVATCLRLGEVSEPS